MVIAAEWENTETDVRGSQTEVILPLTGLHDIHPAEDRILTQTLRNELPDRGAEVQLWDKLKLDREECRLHIFVSETPDVIAIKQTVDGALLKASQEITENMKQREQQEAQARDDAQRRRDEAARVRDRFRTGGS